MAKIDDLLSREQRSDDVVPLDRVPWYARIVGPAPVLPADKVFVTIPDLDIHSKFGPCRWNNAQLASAVVGAECLVIFDNRQNPWVVAIW